MNNEVLEVLERIDGHSFDKTGFSAWKVETYQDNIILSLKRYDRPEINDTEERSMLKILLDRLEPCVGDAWTVEHYADIGENRCEITIKRK